MKKNGYIIIAGCSRFGANIASVLSSRGDDVVIIDIDKNSFRKLSREYSGFKIEGDASNIDTLIDAGIDKATTVLAATDDDNTNIMISQIAKKIFNIDKVISRIYDIDKELVYDGSNIRIIYPTKLTINEFEKIIYTDIVKQVQVKNSFISLLKGGAC